VRKLENRFSRDLRLGAVDVILAKQELAVEVGVIDGVEVDDRQVFEAHEHEILHELAADTASTHD